MISSISKHWTAFSEWSLLREMLDDDREKDKEMRYLKDNFLEDYIRQLNPNSYFYERNTIEQIPKD